MTYEAYIAAAHAHADAFESTDWDAIVRAYDALLGLHDTPVVHCNRAVALAMRGDLALARSAIDELENDRRLSENRYYHMARAAYASARRYAGERDRAVIERRLARLDSA